MVLIGTLEANQHFLVLHCLNLGTMRPFGQGTLCNEGHSLGEDGEHRRNQKGAKKKGLFTRKRTKVRSFLSKLNRHLCRCLQ